MGALRERRVGIRDLKAKLSECVREVKMGATVVVTERGRRVARIVPEVDSMEERLGTLQRAGTILWSGRRLGRARPVMRVRRKPTVAAILTENRG